MNRLLNWHDEYMSSGQLMICIHSDDIMYGIHSDDMKVT